MNIRHCMYTDWRLNNSIKKICDTHDDMNNTLCFTKRQQTYTNWTSDHIHKKNRRCTWWYEQYKVFYNLSVLILFLLLHSKDKTKEEQLRSTHLRCSLCCSTWKTCDNSIITPTPCSVFEGVTATFTLLYNVLEY